MEARSDVSVKTHMTKPWKQSVVIGSITSSRLAIQLNTCGPLHTWEHVLIVFILHVLSGLDKYSNNKNPTLTPFPLYEIAKSTEIKIQKQNESSHRMVL